MTKSHILIRKVEPPRQASVGLRLLSALLLGFALAATVFAQGDETRITTLLPSSTECKALVGQNWQTVADKSTLGISDAFGANNKSACYLEFSIASIPEGAKITEAVLRLVQTDNQPNPSPQLIYVASVPTRDWTRSLVDYEDQNKDFYLYKIRSRSDAVDTGIWRAGSSGSLVRKDENNKYNKYIALLLSPQQSGSGRNYYPFTGDTTNNATNQPRLILTYTVSRSSPLRSPESQSDGWAAMRSPLSFMPDPNVPPQDNYKPLLVVNTNVSSYKAATYGGLIYVIRTYPTQTNTTDWRLDAQDPLGNVVWSKSLPSALREKGRVVVNDSGRLTIVSGNRFIVYQLNTARARQQPSAPLTDKTVSGVTMPAALLPGADGGLYVIGDTDLYALNPDLQMLWRTGVGTSADARMTLGPLRPDGQYVYATGLLPDGNNKTPGLLAINAQSGKTPPLLAFSDITTFHNPVVIKHPDGADYIYIAANWLNSGVLRTLRNKPTLESGDRIASLSQVNDETGFFSQPAPDATQPSGDLSSKKLYVVWRENQKSPARLTSINGQTGKIEKKDTQPQITVEDKSKLWSGENLAMDTKGNIFFWENGVLYGYGAGANQLFARNIPGPPSDLVLLFGSDGTLYMQDSTGGSLFTLIPSYQLPAQSGDIKSPTHLRVDGTVDKDTTLSAGGNVSVGGDFKVKQGSTLSVKTNVPQ